MPVKGLCEMQGVSPEKSIYVAGQQSPSRSSAYEVQHPHEEIGANKQTGIQNEILDAVDRIAQAKVNNNRKEQFLVELELKSKMKQITR